MTIIRYSLFLAVSLLAIGCSTLAPADFRNETPRFEPDRFFEGPVHSWGVVESRSGQPKRRVRGTLRGERAGEELVVTQDLEFDDGQKQHSVWRIRRLDAHRYETVLNDAAGPSIGYASGNAFHWKYTLQAAPGGWFGRVQMEHWMYLMSDGETMINRVTITKLGIRLGQVTETFRRGQPNGISYR